MSLAIVQENSETIPAPAISTLASRRRRSKCSVACVHCRLRKVKCNGGQPCPNCVDHRSDCVYEPQRRRRAADNISAAALEGLQQRLSRIEAVQRQSQPQPQPQPLPQRPQLQPQQPSAPVSEPCNTNKPSPISDNQAPPQVVAIKTPSGSSNDSHSWEQICTELTRVDSPPPLLVPQSLGESVDIFKIPCRDIAHPESEATANSSIGDHDYVAPIFSEESSYEYHGPGSFLSFCSKSGIEWVSQKTGVPDFDQLATRLMADVCRWFRSQSRACPLREPEPDEATAWLYTQAYFDDTSDVVLGVVSRPWFQDRLRLHFNNSPGPGTMDDPAWYALRNTIYAYGARQLLAKQIKPQAFSDAMELGNRYFQNALSVHSDLLFLDTTSVAVQALAVMTHYTEGVSWPSLHYMLCSSAMRLAETKGLHRQPPLSANLNDTVLYSRSCTWWGIYCYDRYSAVRLGRPLGTDDDSITVQLPRNLSPENSAQHETMLWGIRTAQLSSAIMRRLNKFDHRKPSIEEIASTMSELEQSLADLRASFPSYVSPGDSSPYTNVPAGINISGILFLVFSYHISVIQVHSILVYPWNIAKLGLNAAEQTQLQTHIAESSQKCVESARLILQQLGGVTITPSTPKWLAFFFPLTALINVFIHVLQNPQAASVESDVVLMRLAAGHFSYLEYTIPELSFPLTRDLANLAQVAVRRSREKCPAPIDIVPAPDLLGASTSMGQTTQFEDELFPAGFNIWTENWSTFLTSTDL
ncbi:hypothetical protein BHE90_015271 [Fusarium euwallaceae]|uniref:Zn(2)-C6 fungal-type domain-containing protein n=1 Tax=Fusarium euwallaceae TaxID=1147111 RepID=A0A430L3L7_9HYPO|nr:hypothetical protein BHE90_015271 [Fusarium euwallaceae]